MVTVRVRVRVRIGVVLGFGLYLFLQRQILTFSDLSHCLIMTVLDDCMLQESINSCKLL